MNCDKLIETFRNYDVNKLAEYKDLISTKDDNGIFPPYIPHVGKNYNEYKILMYGMAQNVDNPDWMKKIEDKVCQMYNDDNGIDIPIAPYKVMLSIAGIYLYAKHNKIIEDFNEIHSYIAATNYYKFSLNDPNKKKDINPNSKLPNPEKYWKENDCLSEIEMKFLQPNIIISLKGRHNQKINKINENKINLQIINDPSWILRGGSGCLKEKGSWYRKIDEPNINKLVDSYLEQIDGKYVSKKEALKIYLLKYYSDWK